MHAAGEGADARAIAHEVAHPAGLTSARATALIDFADKRARGVPTSDVLPVPLDPPPQGGNIGGMTPTTADLIHELAPREALRLPDGGQVVRTDSTQQASYVLKDRQGNLAPTGVMSHAEVVAHLAPRDPRPAPRQSLRDGQRVSVRHTQFGYGQEGSDTGVIVSYATPEIKQAQMWNEESYYVRFDRDAPGTRRIFSRHALKPISHTSVHAMGFEPGDTLIATRHFSVGSGDRAQRLIAGQEHTVTRVIGSNQVAIDTGNGTELVIPTFDQSAVRRVAGSTRDSLPNDITIRAATPREDSSGSRVKAVMKGRKRLGFVAPSNYGGRSGPAGKWSATASMGRRIVHLGSGYRTRAEAVQALVSFHDDPDAGEHAAARAEMTPAERAALRGEAERAGILPARRREYHPGEQF